MPWLGFWPLRDAFGPRRVAIGQPIGRYVDHAFVMYAVLFALALAAACTSAAQQPQRARAGDVTAIANVTVFDGTGARPRPEMTVVIRGESIVALGPAGKTAIPASAKIVDGRGGFLMPGLWNMHVHGGSYDAARKALPVLLAHGVTGVRDMGMPLDDAIRLKRNDSRDGPHVFVAGPLVQGPLPFENPLIVQVKRPADAAATIAMLKQRGVDFIKIHDAVPEDIYLAVAAAARRAQLPFVGHIPPTVTVDQAIEVGQRSIEHLGGQFLAVLIGASADAEKLHATTTKFYRDAIARLAQGKEPEAPQLRAAFLRAVLDSYRADKAQALFSRFARAKIWHCPTLVALEKLALDHPELDADDKRLNEARFERELEVVHAMNAAGVPLLVGTDTPYADAGPALYRELELLVRAGIPAGEALRAATSGATEFLGLSRSVGTIAVGMRADLVLLAGDPVADIKNVGRVKAVFFAGRVVTR